MIKTRDEFAYSAGYARSRLTIAEATLMRVEANLRNAGSPEAGVVGLARDDIHRALTELTQDAPSIKEEAA